MECIAYSSFCFPSIESPYPSLSRPFCVFVSDFVNQLLNVIIIGLLENCGLLGLLTELASLTQFGQCFLVV